MNILIVYYQSFLIKDLEECLTRMGHSYKCIEANVIVELSDEDFVFCLIESWKLNIMTVCLHLITAVLFQIAW